MKKKTKPSCTRLCSASSFGCFSPRVSLTNSGFAHYATLEKSQLIISKLLGCQKVCLGFSAKCYGKTRMNLLANPIVYVTVIFVKATSIDYNEKFE